jgi:hypothetical protein
MLAVSLVRFMANDCNFMSRSSGLQKMITRPAGRILHSDKPCITLTSRASSLKSCGHAASTPRYLGNRRPRSDGVAGAMAMAITPF